MTTTIQQMREQVRGEVIEPSDDGYDDARKVYNAMHDRRPRAVVRCADAADVAAAVRTGREQGLELAVRGGGHSVPGFGTSDDGLVIDLSPMRNVHVDPAVAVARAGGGAVWGDFDHATHAFGLATTGGVISTTGVSGLTLGGGIGYLARRYGLSCDNLVAADVVTAEGELVTASERQQEDLFWALRGGGGNFGIATSLEFELHPVDEIVGGPIFFELDAAADVLRAYREYIADAPEELGAFFAFQIAPPLPFISEDRQGDTLCAIVTCWTGAPADADAALKPLFDAGPVVAEHVGPMPYPALNSAFDPLLPPGLQHYWKADFVKELTDDAIAAHVEHGSKVPCLQSTMHLYPINGAVQQVGADDTAFAYRDVNFACVIAGMWPEPADNAANTQWVKDYWSAIHPYSGTEGGYVNFMGEDDQSRVAANYGPNYERLSRIKATYDPDNVFHLNQNIEPATT
jgi:FAD/FMN-containing dehydrogenase